MRSIKTYFKKAFYSVCTNSLKSAAREQGLDRLIVELEGIVPDIKEQYSVLKIDTKYLNVKVRNMHAFQCTLMLRALENLAPGKLIVMDIGDSAGTHMIYLQELTKNRFDIDTTSVNLDPRAIKKINSRGLKAILCRAEDLDLAEKEVDLFTAFELVEHLHNPAIFFRNLAKKSKCNKMIITVPYLKHSRVGLHHLRNKTGKAIHAEDEHIFELSPEDWTLLMLHSGWKVMHNKVYYQYPRRWPLINQILAFYWRLTDFEGFWGAILEKETTLSDYYQDW